MAAASLTASAASLTTTSASIATPACANLPESLRAEFLECAVCKHDFDTPKALPCLHTFCAGCLATHVTRSTTATTTLWFLCPLCRAITELPAAGGVHAFKTNQFVTNLGRFLAAQREKYHRVLTRDADPVTPNDSAQGDYDDDIVTDDIKHDVKDERVKPLKVIGDVTGGVLRATTIADVGPCLTVARDVTSGLKVLKLGMRADATCDVTGVCGCGCICGRGSVSFYCDDCEVLACPRCVTSHHRKCSVSMLEDKANREKDRFMNTGHGSRKEVAQLNTGISDLEKYKVQLRTARNEATSGVREQAARLRRLIDKEEDTLLKTIDDVFNSETAKTEKVIKDNRNVAMILKNLTEFSDKLLKVGSAGQIVTWSAHAEEQLRGISSHSRRYGVERIRRNPVQIQFILNSAVNEEDMVKKLIGEIQYGVNVDIVDCNMNDDSRNPTGASCDLNNIKSIEITFTDNDDRLIKSHIHTGELVHSFSAFTDGSHFSPTVVGIAMTSAGDTLVVDKNNKCVKFFGPQGGMFKKIHGSDTLWGVCVLRDGNLAVTDKTVHMFDTRGRLLRVLRQQPRDSHGIAVNSAGDIVVADCMSRCVYTLSVVGGSIKRVIAQRGRAPFKCPANLCLNARDHLIVSDCGAHCVAVFSETGQLLNEYGAPGRPGAGPGELDCPSGVCVDKLGNIVVCDKMNDRVVLLDPRARFLCVLVQGSEVIQRPQAVAMNAQGHIVVAEEEGRIKVFKYREVM